MSRDLIPLQITDLSGFASQLRKQLTQNDELPGHLAFLGMIARAAGFRNYQHLQSQADRSRPLSKDAARKLERALRVFSKDAKMSHWPAATAIQGLCLWPIWFDLERGAELAESQVNNAIKSRIEFEDYPLVRRSLIVHKFMTRTKDGKVYTRLSITPPPEVILLIKSLSAA